MLKTHSITQSAKNLTFSLIVENTEVGDNNSDCEDKIVIRSLSKNLDRVISYLIFNTKKIFI